MKRRTRIAHLDLEGFTLNQRWCWCMVLLAGDATHRILSLAECGFCFDFHQGKLFLSPPPLLGVVRVLRACDAKHIPVPHMLCLPSVLSDPPLNYGG